MSTWRRKALELIPEHRLTIESADTPMFLWTELESVFNHAAKMRDSELLGRIFSYASWCWKESRCNDTVSGVLLAFYENIPSSRDQWWTVPAFISTPDFYELKDVLRYFLNHDQFAEFTTYYLEERRNIEKEALKTKRKRTRRERA